MTISYKAIFIKRFFGTLAPHIKCIYLVIFPLVLDAGCRASLIISIHHDAGLYSRDIIAMVAGGEGMEEEGPVTQSVFALDQISGLAVILTRWG